MRRKLKKTTAITEGTQFNPKETCVFPKRDRSRSSHMDWNSCSSSNEIDAQNVWPHQIPKRPHVQDVCSAAGSSVCEKGSFWLFRAASREQRCMFQRFAKDGRGSGTWQKGQNRKADCFTLLKRITGLKCVNSGVQSVNIHPEKGSLKWAQGTMSGPPWKSH